MRPACGTSQSQHGLLHSVAEILKCLVVLVWTLDISGCARKRLGNNLAWKCLECCNVAVGVDEGKNTTPANQYSRFTNDIYSRTKKLEKCYLTNRIEDLKMQFEGFNNHGIPARHFRARLFPRPFLVWPGGSGVQTSMV